MDTNDPGQTITSRVIEARAQLEDAFKKFMELEDQQLIGHLSGAGLTPKEMILRYLQETRLNRFDTCGRPYSQVANAYLFRHFRLSLKELKRVREVLQMECAVEVLEKSGSLQIRLWLPSEDPAAKAK